MIVLNNSLTPDWTVLATTNSTSSSNTVTVADLSQYKYIAIDCTETAANANIGTVVLPYSVFSNGNFAIANYGSTTVDTRAKYISDTSVNLYKGSTSSPSQYYARLYGIK